MISNSDFKKYVGTLDGLSMLSKEVIEKYLRTYMKQHPNCELKELRKYAQNVVNSVCLSVADAAALVAADFFASCAASAGVSIKNPNMARIPYADGGANDYIYKKIDLYAKGDKEGFIRSCTDFSEYVVDTAANKTTMENVKRNTAGGEVRFARVPTAPDACPFCIMLAGRGAVYHTRQTAGEFNHYHPNCRCKVVAGFKTAEGENVVEGFDLEGLRAEMQDLEAQTGYSFNADHKANEYQFKKAIKEAGGIHYYWNA